LGGNYSKYSLNPNNPLGRHTGEGRYPAMKNTPRSGQNQAVVPLAWGFLTIWIPAFAGMTQFFLMNYLG
jgi:hypothetical protein